MKVLLTGSAGFVGSAIDRALTAQGAQLVRVDLMLGAAHGAATAPEGTHQLDVRDAAGWGQVMRGVDVVCHQAAVVGAGVQVADLPSYASHNDLGTAALLAAMHEQGLHRLVLASSMVVYGDGRYRCGVHGSVVPAARSDEDLRAGRFEVRCPHCDSVLDWALVEEDAPCRPRGSYATSKLAQENYASGWAVQAGGASVALRYHNVYGPYMPRDTPYSGVAAMFRSSLERGEAPRVYEDGGQMRDFVHVEDVARANVAAIERVVRRPAGSDEAFNVCSGVPVTIEEVARLVASGMAQGQESALEPVVTGQYRAADVRHIVASPRLAAEDLGFSATITPDRGLPRLATDPLRA